MSETRIILCPNCGCLKDTIIDNGEDKFCPYCNTKTRVTDLTPNNFYSMTEMEKSDYIISESTRKLNGQEYNGQAWGRRADIQRKSKQSSSSQVKCPKCGSTQIEIKKRGWKITTGFLGSSKNERVCINCLHKF